MTAIDPYPQELLEDEEPIAVNPDAVTNRLIVAINRLAIAIEHHSQGTQNAPGAALAALPPVRPQQVPQADVCPIHGTPWKVVPAGISKKTGAAYQSFRACSTSGCDQRPRQ